jgi:hypothetical protein
LTRTHLRGRIRFFNQRLLERVGSKGRARRRDGIHGMKSFDVLHRRLTSQRHVMQRLACVPPCQRE